ncbi:MAG: GAF domain-containing protein, partial [Calditrichaeota bacterium]
FARLTQLITQLTARVLGSHCAWLELYEPEENRLRVVSHINLSQQQILQNPFDDPEGFNRMIIQEKKPVLINDIPQHPELKHLGNWHQQVRSMLATPLFSNRGQLMGILYAAKSQSYGFDIDDVSLMEGFANQTAIALENAKLWQTSIEKERLEQELKVAREVQLRLVPQEMPRVGGFEIDSYFLTAYEVGGDYYDFIQFSDNLPGVVIGDVSGKGTSAAFYMAEFKGVIQTLAHTSRDPGKLLCRANRIFYPTIERHSFVTAIVGKLIPDRNRFRFARAGHTPVLHCSPARGLVTFLQPPGLGIGLDRGPLFEKILRVEEVELAPGDTLLLFTDGLIELRNAGGEEYGEERLAAMVQECHELSAEALKDRILNDIMDFSEGTPLHDDLTLVIIKRIGRTEVPEKTEEAAAVEPETVA